MSGEVEGLRESLEVTQTLVDEASDEYTYGDLTPAEELESYERWLCWVNLMLAQEAELYVRTR